MLGLQGDPEFEAMNFWILGDVSVAVSQISARQVTTCLPPSACAQVFLSEFVSIYDAEHMRLGLATAVKDPVGLRQMEIMADELKKEDSTKRHVKERLEKPPRHPPAGQGR